MSTLKRKTTVECGECGHVRDVELTVTVAEEEWNYLNPDTDELYPDRMRWVVRGADRMPIMTYATEREAIKAFQDGELDGFVEGEEQ
jgi:hypothetical protein